MYTEMISICDLSHMTFVPPLSNARHSLIEFGIYQFEWCMFDCWEYIRLLEDIIIHHLPVPLFLTFGE